MKLVVEVVGAHDLPSKRGRRVTPFVRVAFGGQRHSTGVVSRPGGETNPTWNETVVFVVDAVAGRLSDRSIDVGVYHRRRSSGGGRSCLGRVRLFGAAVAPSADEAVLLRCPLDRPSFFSPARGEVALRLYLAPYGPPPGIPTAAAAWAGISAYSSSTYATTTFNDTASSSSMAGGPDTVVGGASTQSSPSPSPAMAIKKKHKKKEHPPVQEPLPPPPVHVFNAIPTQSSTGSLIFPPPPPPPPSMPPATKKAAAAAVTGDDAKAAEYLMVDKLEFLYVNVVRARGLSGTDLTLGIDPYVEVRVGNYSAVTRHRVSNHEPEWNQVFAFSKDHLQADTVEVVVKDKNLIVWDSVVGRASIPIIDVPVLAPPNRPLAPQWYFLKGGKKDELTGGEVMVAAWKGSQSDEAFAGALHAGAHDDLPSAAAVAATQTKCYFAPRLCYLRCHVIAAQDLVHPAAAADRRRSSMNVFVRVQLGGAQRWHTRPSVTGKWDEDFFLVAAWPFEEPLEIAVMDMASPERHEVLGQLTLRKGHIKVQQFDKNKSKPPPPAWYDLEPPRSSSSSLSDHGDAGRRDDGGGGRRRHEFRSKIQLRVYYDAAYHVLDEVSTYASDFQPSARPLRSPAVGVLELAVLKATGLRSTTMTNAYYCVAKYGPKWVRTRTLLATSSSPMSWQEQFTFDVFDPCTVLTVAVFDNRQLQQLSSAITDNNNNTTNADDVPLGKVRIRVSTLLSGRTYEHPYSLFTLTPAAGLLRCGELHLAVRFTTHSPSTWLNMISLYLRPPLPNQHFAKPIPTSLIPRLRRAAADVVASRLARAEPPLLPAAVHYLLRDPAAHPSPHMPERHEYSTRRCHAACARLRDVVGPLAAFARWFGGVRDWDSPVTTVLVLLVFLVLTWKPNHVLPTFFVYLFTIGVRNFCRRWRQPERPPQMEHYSDGVPRGMLADEFDAGLRLGKTTSSPEAVLQWYWRLQGTAANVQGLLGDVASVGERVQALLEWRDARATVIALVAVAALTAVTYAVPFKVLVSVMGVYLMRHPLLRRRKKEPSALMSFFRRLPSNADVML